MEVERGDSPPTGHYGKIRRTCSLTGGLQGVIAELQMWGEGLASPTSGKDFISVSCWKRHADHQVRQRPRKSVKSLITPGDACKVIKGRIMATFWKWSWTGTAQPCHLLRHQAQFPAAWQPAAETQCKQPEHRPSSSNSSELPGAMALCFRMRCPLCLEFQTLLLKLEKVHLSFNLKCNLLPPPHG